MHRAADGAAGAGGFVAAFGAGLAFTRVEDGDHGGADCSSGLRDGHAFPGRAHTSGRMARAVGAVGVVSECGGERYGECGGADLRDLSGAGADADYRRTVLSGGAGGGGAGADQWGSAGGGTGTGGAGEVTRLRRSVRSLAATMKLTAVF